MLVKKQLFKGKINLTFKVRNMEETDPQRQIINCRYKEQSGPDAVDGLVYFTTEGKPMPHSWDQSQVKPVENVLQTTASAQVVGLSQTPEPGFVEVEEQLGEGWFQLDSGEYLHNHVGKYKSGLTIITPFAQMIWVTRSGWEFNIEPTRVETIRGEFFTSKKGTNCFRIDPEGPHVLMKDGWGGTFNKYRGNSLPFAQAKWHRRASSNGGGAGIDWAIFDHNFKQAISIDNI
jgi:hypothetical protein